MTAHFNAVAHTWDEDPRRGAVAAAIVAKMLGALRLTPQTTLLDYGAGTGLVSLALAPHVGRLIAVDEAGGMLDILRAKLADADPGNVEIMHWSAGQDSSGLPEFDVITGSMVLHHVEDIPAAAAVFHGLLRPGGVVAFADLDLDDGRFHGKEMHTFHPGFDRNWLREVFEKAGFTSATFQEAHQVAKKLEDGKERAFPIFLMTAVRSSGGWGLLNMLRSKATALQNEIQDLRTEKAALETTVAQLSERTWGLKLLENQEGRFIVLPPKTTPKTGWTVGKQQAVKLE